MAYCCSEMRVSTSEGDGKCSEDNVVITTAETKIEICYTNGNCKFIRLKILIVVFLVVSSR